MAVSINPVGFGPSNCSLGGCFLNDGCSGKAGCFFDNASESGFKDGGAGGAQVPGPSLPVTLCDFIIEDLLPLKTLLATGSLFAIPSIKLPTFTFTCDAGPFSSKVFRMLDFETAF